MNSSLSHFTCGHLLLRLLPCHPSTRYRAGGGYSSTTGCFLVTSGVVVVQQTARARGPDRAPALCRGAGSLQRSNTSREYQSQCECALGGCVQRPLRRRAAVLFIALLLARDAPRVSSRHSQTKRSAADRRQPAFHNNNNNNKMLADFQCKKV